MIIDHVEQYHKAARVGRVYKGLHIIWPAV